jgi:hypothetical protein
MRETLEKLYRRRVFLRGRIACLETDADKNDAEIEQIEADTAAALLRNRLRGFFRPLGGVLRHVADIKPEAMD